MNTPKEKAMKSLEGFRLNVMLGLDVSYDVYMDDDVLKAIDIAIDETEKEASEIIKQIMKQKADEQLDNGIKI